MEDEMIEIWMRAGISMTVAPCNAKKLLEGCDKTLTDVLKSQSWRFDGDSYIPGVVVDELRDKLRFGSTEFNDDVSFEIGADFSAASGIGGRNHGT